METPISIFYSYAPQDKAFCDQLEAHLTILELSGRITGWHQRKILAGQEHAKETAAHLNAAQVILLLISPDFLSSSSCYGVEMVALERHRRGEAYVIPILLRPGYYRGAPFEHLKILPSNGKPITSWIHRDEAFADIVNGINDVLHDLTSTDPASSSPGITPGQKPAGPIERNPPAPGTRSSGTVPNAGTPQEQIQVNPSKLREAMYNAYNLGELEILCADLNPDVQVRYEDLGEGSLRVRIHRLITYCQQRGQYETLVQYVLADRPHLIKEIL